MASDEERREVARRLRELVPCLFDDGEYIDCGEVEGALGLVSEDGAWYTAASVTRLADLIEPDMTTDTTKNAQDTTKCDREALLALADEIEDNDVTYSVSAQYVLDGYARRIREALGVEDDHR